MCKIMCVAGIKPENTAKVQKLMSVAAKNMSIVEDDGVGYAAITNEGYIYGEKWRNKDDAFKIHTNPTPDPLIEYMDDMFGGMAEWPTPTVTETDIYRSFGQRTVEALDSTVAVILHARKASAMSEKNIHNVHPFMLLNDKDHPDTALIHNGNIINHAKLTKTQSTCDSEVILHEYLREVMYHNPWGINEMAKTLVGGYVVGVLSSMVDNNGGVTPILDIFKSDSTKDLCAGYVPELDTMVFCTSEYVLNNSISESGMTVNNIIKIKEGYLMRLNAVTGTRMEDLISFTPSQKYEYDGYTSTRSIGPQKIVVTDGNVKKEIENSKREFERKHPSLFTQPYIEVHNKLEQDERDLFSELSKSPNTNHKALHLVAVALATAPNQERVRV